MKLMNYELFSINPYAEYKGELFPVSEERTTGKVLLDTTNTELAIKMGFERTDKYIYPNMWNRIKWELPRRGGLIQWINFFI